jgi:hypothetical protein
MSNQVKRQYNLSIFQTPPDEKGNMQTLQMTLIASCKSHVYESFKEQIEDAYQIALFDTKEQKWYDKESLTMFVIQAKLSVDAYFYAENSDISDLPEHNNN